MNIIAACTNYFWSADKSSELAKCIQMADDINVIVVSSSSQSLIPARVNNYIIKYIQNDLTPPIRENFIMNATLGTWGTLKEF